MPAATAVPPSSPTFSSTAKPAFASSTRAAGSYDRRSCSPGTPPPRSGAPRSGGASHNRRFTHRRAGGTKGASSSGGRPSSDEHEILFQKFFKSVGPRTYAAQVKRAKNGNHYLVLMEGKREESSGDVRKTRLFIYSEDFVEFFRLIKSAAEFIKDHPLPDDIRQKRERYWSKQSGGRGDRGPAKDAGDQTI